MLFWDWETNNLWKSIMRSSITRSIFLKRKIFLNLHQETTNFASNSLTSTLLLFLQSEWTSLLREDWNVIWFSFAHSPSFYFLPRYQKFSCHQWTEAFTAIKSGTALVAFQRTEYCSYRNHQVSHFVQHKGCLCYRTWALHFETSS